LRTVRALALVARLTAGVLLVLAGLALAAGCGGGGGGGSAEDEVKDTVADYLEAIIDGRNGEACAMTTDPEECVGALALAQGFLGEGGFEALLGEDWRERLEAAEVTFADDDHATLPPLSPEDESPTELVREDDRWLIVVEEDAAEEPTSVATDTAATTEEEPPVELTASVGGTLTLAGNEEGLQMDVTLLKVVDPAKASDEFLKPGKGKRYAAFQLRLANVGDVLYQDSPSNGAAVVDTEDQQFSASFFDAVEPGLGSLRIRPGDQRAGYITFELPKAANLRTFQFTLDSGFGPDTGEWELG
jgi:hypothetical protein